MGIDQKQNFRRRMAENKKCDSHNFRIKSKIAKKEREKRNEQIEAAVFASASGKDPRHYLGDKLYKKVFNQR